MVPVEPGLMVPWTGPGETHKAPCMWISASGWASAKALVEAKVPELESARLRLCWAVNPDPG